MKPLRTDIDRLIDWYEKFKPDAGRRIPVAATPLQLAKVTGLYDQKRQQYPRVQPYRDRELVAEQ